MILVAKKFANLKISKHSNFLPKKEKTKNTVKEALIHFTKYIDRKRNQSIIFLFLLFAARLFLLRVLSLPLILTSGLGFWLRRTGLLPLFLFGLLGLLTSRRGSCLVTGHLPESRTQLPGEKEKVKKCKKEVKREVRTCTPLHSSSALPHPLTASSPRFASSWRANSSYSSRSP